MVSLFKSSHTKECLRKVEVVSADLLLLLHPARRLSGNQSPFKAFLTEKGQGKNIHLTVQLGAFNEIKQVKY